MNVTAQSRTELILSNYSRVLDRVSSAAIKSGRHPEDVEIVVVSKGQPIKVIQSAVEAGIRIFGENYPEETAPKIQSIHNSKLEWHMIGHLQSRKIKIVCEYFDWFQALDSLHLGEKLNRALVERNKRMPVLLEMNVGGEEGKSGWLADKESEWAQIADAVVQIREFPNLDIRGLMTMPPLELAMDKSRVYFAKLRRLRDFIQNQNIQLNLHYLSMGTSNDFEAAVVEGATMIRVGQAILGPRPEQ